MVKLKTVTYLETGENAQTLKIVEDNFEDVWELVKDNVKVNKNDFEYLHAKLIGSYVVKTDSGQFVMGSNAFKDTFGKEVL